MKTHRPSWHVYFGDLARQVSTRSTCSRKKVGAIIVRNKNILSTGYNGSIKGGQHCTSVGCLIENGHCVRTIHAEANAIIQSAKNGVRIEGADIYVTASPCFNCFKLIANAGIKNIYYLEFYRDEKIINFANELGIGLIDLSQIDVLTKLAASNGVITDEEKQLLDKFMSDLEEFNHLLLLAVKNNKLDEIEKNNLQEMREKIIEISYDTASSGKEVSNDSQKLIKEMGEMLNRLLEI